MVVASSPSLEEIRRLVGAGYGIGCLPQHVVADEVAAGELWRLLREVDVLVDPRAYPSSASTSATPTPPRWAASAVYAPR